jgi:hypothetical protein
MYTNSGHSTKSQGMENEAILQIWFDRMIVRYAHHKPFTVNYPDKCVNEFSPDNTDGLV